MCEHGDTEGYNSGQEFSELEAVFQIKLIWFQVKKSSKPVYSLSVCEKLKLKPSEAAIFFGVPWYSFLDNT